MSKDRKINTRTNSRYFAILLAIALCASFPSMAEDLAGFGLSATRVVAMADSHRGTLISAQNNTDQVYLIQNRIYPPDGLTGYPQYNAAGAISPFIITPPLKRLNPQSRLPLRVMVVPDNQLPHDRESLFFLATKAIPSITKRKSDSELSAPRIVLALQQVIKLYYRPVGLKSRAIFDGDVAPSLSMSIIDGRLKVSNPTPYYIAFFSLSVNGHPLSDEELRKLTPPKGVQGYSLTVRKGDRVQWQVIDEFGLGTPVQSQTL